MKVGRPSITAAWTGRVRDLLREHPGLSTAELLRRLRGMGYTGGKSAFYQLAAVCRPRPQG